MKSDFKIALQYLLFSIFFIVTSFILAYYFWWRIDEGSVEFFIIVLSTMICWVGISYLSTLISSKIIFNNLLEVGFVSPFKLIKSGFFYETKGIKTAKKFKTTFSSFAFSILFVFIFLFYKIVNFVEKTELTYYGVEKIVKIEKISYYRGSKRAHLSFEFDNKKIKKVIYLKDTLKKVGDFEKIIFSFRNPYILKSKIDFEENSR